MSEASVKTVVLGVSGGIAAYKSLELVSRLRKAGVRVHVVMTGNACEFIRPLSFQSLSENQVAVDTFVNPQYWEVEHIALAKKADVIVIAPATANVIAKIANGLADDMLTTTVLASKAPLLIAPAMNTQMYEAAATQENIRILRGRGARFVGPGGGFLACGDWGAGRMSEALEIFEALMQMLGEPGGEKAQGGLQIPMISPLTGDAGREAPGQDYAGLKVLVTAGPTRERLDPVRFVTNRSSGRMGLEIARALRMRGAEVTLVHGPICLSLPEGVATVPVESTQDLYEAVMQRAPAQDILIQAAAPSDYRAAQMSEQKIKKQDAEPLRLELVETPDIAQEAGQHKKPGQTFVGFAAETNDHLENARRKLVKKNLDLICLNDVTQPGAGFDVETNQLTLVTANSISRLPMLSKAEAAGRLLDQILLLRKGR